MKTILKRIIALNIEFEGALRVAENRPSEEALEVAKMKFAEISALFATLNPADFSNTYSAFSSPRPEQYVEHIDTSFETELKIEEAEGAEEDPLAEPTMSFDEFSEDDFSEDVAEEDFADELVETAEEDIEDAVDEDFEDDIEGNFAEPTEDITEAFAAPIEVEDTDVDSMAFNTADDNAQIAEDNTPEAEEMSESDHHDYFENPAAIKTELEPEPVAEAAQESKPVSPRKVFNFRKAFTLNDKFMFKRELFSNSDEEFNSTLDLFGAMQTFDEVEEYAYEDMQWDAQNPLVKEFMSIIRNSMK